MKMREGSQKVLKWRTRLPLSVESEVKMPGQGLTLDCLWRRPFLPAQPYTARGSQSIHRRQGAKAKPGPAEMPMNPVSIGIIQVPHNMDGDLNTR